MIKRDTVIFKVFLTKGKKMSINKINTYKLILFIYQFFDVLDRLTPGQD